jgi:hypothetical protein
MRRSRTLGVVVSAGETDADGPVADAEGSGDAPGDCAATALAVTTMANMAPRRPNLRRTAPFDGDGFIADLQQRVRRKSTADS